jgi:hypothetical protein
MKEPLTISETQSVVNDLKSELQRVQNEIKSKGAVNTAVDFLQNKQSTLQSKINDLLKKGGIITEEDYNESYLIIRSNKEGELKNLYKKSNTKLFTYIGIGVILVVGYLYFNRKK